MNAFYKVKTTDYTDTVEFSGIVFGEDEADMMKKIVEAYNPTEVTFWFGENFDADIVEIEDFKECPLFDFH